ncbi:MAG: YeeE/YedE family protein [Gammaproteobacteria bacterium]|nr:YeeE/YedE family protein [Gammaproteobacteria bacterium]
MASTEGEVSAVLQSTEAAETNRERRNQMWAFGIVGFFALITIWSYAVDVRYVYLATYIWFGLVYGMALQYGRFCMASAFRDLFAVGVPRMTVGIIIALVLFSLVSAVVTGAGESTFHPIPYGYQNVIGGVIFGLGMVFAGGCASGSLYKSGEGTVASWIVILSLSFSQTWFASAGGWLNDLVPASWTASAAAKNLPAVLSPTNGWYNQYMAGYIWNLRATTVAELTHIKSRYLAAFVGNSLLNTIIPAVFILAVVYVIWYRKSHLKNIAKTGAKGWRAELRGYWSMISASRRTAIAGLVIGVAAGLHMWVTEGLRHVFGVLNAGELLQAMGHTSGLSIQNTVFDPGYWYITTQEAQWSGWLLHVLGVHDMRNIFYGLQNGLPNPLLNPPGWMSIAIILGSSVMARLSNEFRLKLPTLETAIWALLGGALMGIGARIGIGCNIGAFFIPVANGDPSGWLFGLGLGIGAYVCVQFYNWWINRQMAKEDIF